MELPASQTQARLNGWLLEPDDITLSIREQLMQSYEPHRNEWTTLEVLQHFIQDGFVKPTLELGLTVGLTGPQLKQREMQVAQRLAWYLTKEDWMVEDAVGIVIEGLEACLRRYQLIEETSLKVIGWDKGREVMVTTAAPHFQPPPMPLLAHPPPCGSTEMTPTWANLDGASLLQAAQAWVAMTLRWNRALSKIPRSFYSSSALSVINSPYVIHQDLSPELHRVVPFRLASNIELRRSGTEESLAPITFDQLQCPARHAGRSLLIRIISSPLVSTGITLFVEDRLGQAMNLNIAYPFRQPALRIPQAVIDILFPQGAAIVIDHPNVWFGSTSGQPEIHVNFMKEIRMVPFSGAAHWGRPSPGAVSRLRQCAEIFEALHQDLLENHFLSLAIGVEPSFETQSRKAKVLMKLGQSGEAYRLLKSIKSETCQQQSDSQLVNLLAKNELRLGFCGMGSTRNASDPRLVSALAKNQEEQNGVYNWTGLQQDLEAQSTLDIADFVGPVTVRGLPGKGRGLITTRAVRAGEILLVEKALASAGPEDLGNYDLIGVSLSKTGETVTRSMTTSLVLLHKAMVDIADDPSLYLAWQGLGPDATRPSPLTTEEERLDALEGAVAVDCNEMYEKHKHNAFRTSTEAGTAHWHSRSGCEGYEYLFKMISMINHSCSPTAHYNLLADVMVVRAIDDIPARKEITMAYCAAPWRSYAKRQESTARYGFACACELCAMDKMDDYSARRAIIGDTNLDALKPTQPRISTKKETSRLSTPEKIKLVYETYAPGRSIMPEIAVLLLSLPAEYNDRQKFMDGLVATGCIVASESQRRSTGYALERISLLVDCKLLIRACLIIAIKTADADEVAAWRKSAFWIYDMARGPGVTMNEFERIVRLED